MELPRHVTLQALAVVNAFGDVVEPRSGEIIAGARLAPDSPRFADMENQMFLGKTRKGFGTTNTTLVVVMTNAGLTKLQATKVAQMAQDGLARAVRPVHTLFDGDLVFALSVGEKRADINLLGTAAANAAARAIVRAVTTARGLGGLPSCTELRKWKSGNRKPKL
jgi:L-aminopeptidase/D-esterase-like protein